jgi:hypothetical protein
MTSIMKLMRTPLSDDDIKRILGDNYKNSIVS